MFASKKPLENRVFITTQNIYDAPASLPQSYVHFGEPEYL